MTAASRLLLVGCGKMGGALLQRVAAAGIASAIAVVEPSGLAGLPTSAAGYDAPEKIPETFRPDLIILAIKPQQMAEVLPHYARFRQSLFLSIAAGMTLARLEALLGGPGVAIVRAMPNLPASLGAGMTVAVAGAQANEEQRKLADAVLKTVGMTAWVENENLLDAVTALSGSGPAYVFALCEAMAQAGVALGLSADMAALLARQTVVGSGALLAQSPESAATLRRAVTSPGGTTEAALKHLLAAGGLPDLLQTAMTAAARRAAELAR